MACSRGDRGNNPFRDITNIAAKDPNDQSQVTDPKALKRQRDRERYANMPTDKKNELLKRQRQSYRAKKVAPTLASDDSDQSVPCNVDMASTQSVLPELGRTLTEQGSHNVFVQTCSSARNKDNISPQKHDNTMRGVQGANPIMPGSSGVRAVRRGGVTLPGCRRRWLTAGGGRQREVEVQGVPCKGRGPFLHGPWAVRSRDSCPVGPWAVGQWSA